MPVKAQSPWSCTTVHIREKCVKGPDSRKPLIQERGRSLVFNYEVDITEQKDCSESLAENKRGQINQAKWNSMESSINTWKYQFLQKLAFWRWKWGVLFCFIQRSLKWEYLVIGRLFCKSILLARPLICSNSLNFHNRPCAWFYATGAESHRS